MMMPALHKLLHNAIIEIAKCKKCSVFSPGEFYNYLIIINIFLWHNNCLSGYKCIKFDPADLNKVSKFK